MRIPKGDAVAIVVFGEGEFFEDAQTLKVSETFRDLLVPRPLPEAKQEVLDAGEGQEFVRGVFGFQYFSIRQPNVLESGLEVARNENNSSA